MVTQNEAIESLKSEMTASGCNLNEAAIGTKESGFLPNLILSHLSCILLIHVSHRGFLLTCTRYCVSPDV